MGIAVPPFAVIQSPDYADLHRFKKVESGKLIPLPLSTFDPVLFIPQHAFFS
jgi:hypothetical protein